MAIHNVLVQPSYTTLNNDLLILRYPEGDCDYPKSDEDIVSALYDEYQCSDDIKDGDIFIKDGSVIAKAEGVHIVPVLDGCLTPTSFFAADSTEGVYDPEFGREVAFQEVVCWVEEVSTGYFKFKQRFAKLESANQFCALVDERNKINPKYWEFISTEDTMPEKF